MTNTLPLYFKYWGKSERDGSSYHLLPYHCLDVAAVVAVWWKSSSAIRYSFCEMNEYSESEMLAWVLFFTALHDYGKFDLRFQRKVLTVWKMLHPLSGDRMSLPSQLDVMGYRHGENGLSWFDHDFAKLHGCNEQTDTMFLDAVKPPHWLSWKPWVEAVMGHHGHIKDTQYVTPAALPSVCDSRFAEIDEIARVQWLKSLEQLFLIPCGFSVTHIPPGPSPLLPGLCSVSDWIASRNNGDNFIFNQGPQDLENYFRAKVEADAACVFACSGIYGKAKKFDSVQALLPSTAIPLPLQSKIRDLPMGPGLSIIEAPTGTGKTEAALAYAWRLLDAGFADSIVFALPTQATANAMLGRIEKLAIKIFSASPNLVLAHGSARFNKEFAELKHKGWIDKNEPDGWAQCTAWLAESRKRVFLGQVGICTIDQVLMSVLPVKHRFVRGFGIGRSVLIVDEVHAYDAYMYGLLEEVLHQQQVAGASAILLSATLPTDQRQQLCAAWNSGQECEYPGKAPYPLITWVGASEFKFDSCKPNERSIPYEVTIECCTTDDLRPDENLFQRIGRAAESGAQVAIICNMVQDAQQIYHLICNVTSAQVQLFHSRFRFKDRQNIEQQIVARFGPDGKREQGCILVATQVIEQSLDVDFDWLITQICPIDLLFQRMGRLHRHKREKRPEGLETPHSTILLPMNCGDYGFTGKIYANTRVLWRTEHRLTSAPQGKVCFPDAYREWIESVYQDKPWIDEPPEMTQAYEKFKDDLFISRCQAKQQINSAVNPFADTDEAVAALTRDGEMGLTVVPFVVDNGRRRLLDGESVDRLDEFHKAEVEGMNSIPVPSRWRSWLEDLAEKDDDGRYWLAMRERKEAFMVEGGKIGFRYQLDTGLEMRR